MKRTLDQIKAFEIAKESIPNLQLKVAGDTSGAYGKKVISYIKDSKFSNDIEVCGRVSKDEKIELMQKSHLLLVTSIKEGWGLVVTEAASQGTPSVVYDVDGLRDSVNDGYSGIVVKSDEKALAGGIVSLMNDNEVYNKLRTNGYIWSEEITFFKAYESFKKVVKI